MSLITTRPAVRMIGTACGLPGANAPRVVRDAFERAETITSSTWQPAGADELTTAILDALADRRDPSTDETVTRLLTSRALAAAIDARNLEDAAWQAAASTLADHADDIVHGLRPSFQAAAERMYDALPVIGQYALTEHETILALGGDAAEHYVQVRAAEDTITKILDGWTALASIARRTVSPDRLPRLAEVPTPWAHDHPLRGKPSAWDVARAGVDLNLPTLDEYGTRNSAANPAPVPESEVARNSFRNDPVRQAEAATFKREHERAKASA